MPQVIGTSSLYLKTEFDIDLGTSVGDPIEANAAGELFSRKDDVLIGSVKGNLGLVKFAFLGLPLANYSYETTTGI